MRWISNTALIILTDEHRTAHTIPKLVRPAPLTSQTLPSLWGASGKALDEMERKMTLQEFESMKARNRKVALAHLQDTPPKPIEKVEPHKFPPLQLNHRPTEFMLRMTANAFERIERAYHGVDPLQPTGNLAHDLTALIKSKG